MCRDLLVKKTNKQTKNATSTGGKEHLLQSMTGAHDSCPFWISLDLTMVVTVDMALQ